MDTITQYYIYPAIGIARVGNSPDEFFIGPEAPDQGYPEGFKFKDQCGRVKRQAARFRIYGLNRKGDVVKEITDDEDTKIEWRVHLANRKAINYQFNNAMDLDDIALESRLRNETVTDWGDRTENLLIDPGKRRISGCGQKGKQAFYFDSGTFYKKKVPLGELQTDEKGRLLVLGGFGHSASKTGAQAITFANNDDWHDDVSDGPVRATICYKGQTFEANPAMVAVTPPNFGPGLRGVVTMYDVVKDLFIANGVWKKPETVEFWKDINPIFKRLVDNQAVNEGIYFQFGQNSPGDLTQEELSIKLASTDKKHESLRRYVFDLFRNPLIDLRQDDKQPPFYGDAFGDFNDSPKVNLSLTETQYSQLLQWANGDFKVNDKGKLLESIDTMPLAEQPAALTATNLLECLGGPFHPGIELTWFLRRLSMWDIQDKIDPMRLNILPEEESPKDDFGPILRPDVALKEMFNVSGPGTLTRFMGVPWQTDEASCRSGYDTALYLPTPSFWSARVPNQVMSKRSLERLDDKSLPQGQRLKHMDYRQDWLRFFQGSYQQQINGMVQKWDKIGIVTKHSVSNNDEDMGIPSSLWVESELDESLTESDPSFIQLLLLENLNNSPKKDASSIKARLPKSLKGSVGSQSEASKDPENRPVYRRNERL